MFVVTGASSNTGTAVANSLLDRGIPVRVIGRRRERLDSFVRRGAEALLKEASDKRTLVAGAHLDFPGVGYVARESDGFRFVPEQWVLRI